MIPWLVFHVFYCGGKRRNIFFLPRPPRINLALNVAGRQGKPGAQAANSDHCDANEECGHRSPPFSHQPLALQMNNMN